MQIVQNYPIEHESHMTRLYNNLIEQENPKVGFDEKRCKKTEMEDAAWGAETSGGGWQVVNVVKFQVENVPFQEMRWGAGLQRKRCENEKCY